MNTLLTIIVWFYNVKNIRLFVGRIVKKSSGQNTLSLLLS